MAKVVYSKSRFDRNDAALNMLAFAAGTTDVLVFVALGAVFTSAMTGNTALLGLALGQGQMQAVTRALDALLAFLLGVAVGTVVQREGLHRRDVAAVLGLEAIGLGLFVVVWDTAGPNGPAVYVLIFLSAAAMGIQSVAARIFNLPGIPTIVFTSTLTSIMMSATNAVMKGTPLPLETARQIVVFLTYFLGALLSGLLATRSIGLVVALPLVAVVAALALQFRPQRHP